MQRKWCILKFYLIKLNKLPGQQSGDTNHSLSFTFRFEYASAKERITKVACVVDLWTFGERGPSGAHTKYIIEDSEIRPWIFETDYSSEIVSMVSEWWTGKDVEGSGRSLV
jgi:hypothetical protein